MSIIAGQRILIVEDDAIIAMVLEEMLLDLGAAVVGPAASVSRGVELASAGDIDVAIVDLNLGGTRSDPVMAALSAAGTPFVIASGYGESATKHPGASAWRMKPYDPSQIARALTATLEQKILQRTI